MKKLTKKESKKVVKEEVKLTKKWESEGKNE